MKKYNIKVKLKSGWMTYSNCYLIENLDSFKDYLIEMNNRFYVSETEILTIKTFIGHGYSYLTGVCLGLSDTTVDYSGNKEKRQDILAILKLLQAKTLTGMLSYLLDGYSLVVHNHKVGGYFPIKEQDYQIIETSNKKYTKKDIKINKWTGGSHYYAKVGNIDVVDDNGNVKWNTEEYAYEVALEYMKSLNKGL